MKAKWQSSVFRRGSVIAPGGIVSFSVSGGGAATLYAGRANDSAVVPGNTVIADANGFAEAFLDEGVYDITVATADGQQEYQFVVLLADLHQNSVDSVNGQTGAVVIGAGDVGAYPDNNPSGYVDATGAAAAAPVQSVNAQTGAVVLTASSVGALASGDDVSELNNDAGYVASSDVSDIVKLTQAEYDALSPPVATTLYIVVG
jgi:hypothetical protein